MSCLQSTDTSGSKYPKHRSLQAGCTRTPHRSYSRSEQGDSGSRSPNNYTNLLRRRYSRQIDGACCACISQVPELVRRQPDVKRHAYKMPGGPGERLHTTVQRDRDQTRRPLPVAWTSQRRRLASYLKNEARDSNVLHDSVTERPSIRIG